MKSDITSREDILLIITKFYDQLIDDDTMYPFFKEFVQQKTLAHHLDVITDFWQDILFDTTTYKSNVLQKHVDKNVFIAFKKEHFSIWLQYLFSTIDIHFSGLKSELMKNRAQSIATVMQLKMNLYN
ncbi:hemoglobin [Tenacibaculum adriaticum]|uniref:Hemoglobin n=1 Tax=Tenacibaculum adriaticum TaxID=413713 RepID=A0A5S5DN36_9FLAO|nr:group III truncated hemoglobin [Tenacibaculum adriaticum]TYP97360.1 hemoglobin [Tenacibaculum adriaticum]